MKLIIRLQRFGKIKKPFYKIALFKKLSGRQSKFFMEFGYYDPIKKQIYINKVLLHKYINFGSQILDTVRHIILKLIL